MSAPSQPCVATLIARPGAARLDATLLADVTALLPGAGEPAWLEPERAADVPFVTSADRLAALDAEVGATLAGRPIDRVLQLARDRRKALLLADMDSTVIGQECIDELADFAGLKAEVAEITERAMRGELPFEPALRERVALLADMPVEVVARVLAERITLDPGASTLVATMRAKGGYCALVSGGFTLFTGAIAARVGFDEHRANVLDVAEGRLRGTVAEPILGRDAKRERLVALRTERGLRREAVLAVGDGANDLAMLAEAGLGVAFHAKPAVAAAAQARIEHNDLSALLFIQGYTRGEFAA